MDYHENERSKRLTSGSKDSCPENLLTPRGIDGSAPILFLDVDGVLTTTRGLMCDYSPDDETLFHVDRLVPELEGSFIPAIERDRVANLREVVESVSGLQIVVSSTWREDPEYFTFLMAALRAGGIDVDTVVLDKTPILSGGNRGAEVKQWLSFHPSRDSFAIVDDGHIGGFDEHGLSSRMVLTHIDCRDENNEGLTRQHAKQIVDMLSSESC